MDKLWGLLKGRQKTNPIKVGVRSLVVSYIDDHFFRASLAPSTPAATVLYGVLIGENSGNQISVTDSFPVEDIGDLKFIKQTLRNYYTHSSIVGWYRTGTNDESDIAIHSHLSNKFGCVKALIVKRDPYEEAVAFTGLKENVLRKVDKGSFEIYEQDRSFTETFIRLSLANVSNVDSIRARLQAEAHRKNYERKFVEAFPTALGVRQEFKVEAMATTGEVLEILEKSRKYTRKNQATEYLKKEISLNKALGRNADINNEIGEIAASLKNFFIAFNYFNAALKLDPRHEKAQNNLDRILPMLDALDNAFLVELFDKLKAWERLPRSNPGLKAILQNSYFLHIFETNRIEGNRLSLEEVRKVVTTDQEISRENVKDQHEVMGVKKAMRVLEDSGRLQLGKLRLEDLLDMHREIMEKAEPSIAGHLRDEAVVVGRFNVPHHDQIPHLMICLVEFCNNEATLQTIHPVEFAAFAHFYLVSLHPFIDGNGRSSRLFMNSLLTRLGYPAIIIPSAEKQKYVGALDASATALRADSRQFLRYVVRRMMETVDTFIQASWTPQKAGSGETPQKIGQHGNSPKTLI